MKDLRKKNCITEKPKFELPEAEKNCLIKQYEPCPTSSGKTHRLRQLQGAKLTYRGAILAKCFECCGGYADGRYDCGSSECPLIPFMPYRWKRPKGVDIEHIQ